MTNNEIAYAAMCLKSEAIGLPVYYKEDLHVHDKTNLGLMPIPYVQSTWPMVEGSPFVWLVRECGTEIIYLGSTTSDDINDASLINLSTLAYREKNVDKTDRTFLWKGENYLPILVEIPINKARGMLYEASYLFHKKRAQSKETTLAHAS